MTKIYLVIVCGPTYKDVAARCQTVTSRWRLCSILFKLTLLMAAVQSQTSTTNNGVFRCLKSNTLETLTTSLSPVSAASSLTGVK